MQKNRVKGTYDLFPGAKEWQDPLYWNFLEDLLRKISRLYGFFEIRTPIFEHTELFTRAVGNETDIGSKEMYTFEDRGGRSLSLKPEGTASVIRAFNENGMHQTVFDRLFYISQNFRYDRPQKGRFRQFQQFGVEAFGKKDPSIDAEIISMAWTIYQELGIKNVDLLINSIGTIQTRKSYAEKLRAFLEPKKSHLSEDSQRRLETNPFRILDSKDKRDIEALTGATTILNELDVDSRNYFDEVCNALTKIRIPFTVETTLVRGLDYYTDTVFEIVANDDAAAQNTLCAGGRYDGLVKTLGGPDLPGFGFALGFERTLDSMLTKGKIPELPFRLEVYIVPLCQEALNEARKITCQLRECGQSARLHENNYNLKKGLQTATKINAKYVLLLGEDELKRNSVKLKNLLSREEEEIKLDTITHYNW